MLIGVFKSNKKIINGLPFLLVVFLLLPSFFSKSELTKITLTGFIWLDAVFLIALITVQSVFFNFIVNKFELLKDSSHLTSLFFAFLNSCFVLYYGINEVVIANTFILIAFYQMLSLYNSKNNYSKSFNVGFLIGVAVLIYFPVIIYFAVLWIVLVYTITSAWRNFIISLIGLLLPTFYIVAYQFILGDFPLINFDNYIVQTSIIEWGDFTLYNKLFLIELLILLLFAFFNLFITIDKSVIRIRKMLTIILLMFVLGLVTLFINRYDFSATFLVVSIPLAIIVANLFQNIKKTWIAEVVFTLLFSTLLLNYFS